MAIPSRQIGWGTESNLLWQILKQLTRLTSTLFSLKEAATPKYKVYTALLTQSGGDDPNGNNGGTSVGNYPELVIGRTYYIADNFQLECDFTNVGAPNNNVGTYFVATGTTPASWGTYGFLQYNTGAPVVTVLENTIGNIWFSYYATGLYFIYSDSLFISDKTFIIGSMWGDDSASPRIFGGYYSDENNLIFGNGSVNDNFQINLEIRVYN
jgi:hypothetical protein